MKMTESPVGTVCPICGREITVEEEVATAETIETASPDDLLYVPCYYTTYNPILPPGTKRVHMHCTISTTVEASRESYNHER